MWTLMNLCVFTLLAYCGTDASCRYEFNVPDSDFQCSTHSNELGASVNRLETRQNLNEGRQQSTADTFKREMSTLAEDTRASKLVVNRLVEDTAELQGKLHVLQDMQLEVRGLRSQLWNVSHDLSGRTAGLQERVLDIVHSLDQATNGQILATSRLKEQLDTQAAAISQLEAKVTAVERGLADQPSTSGIVDDLQGMVRDLSNKVDSLTRRVEQIHVY